ncbi:MAG: diguanylate cyclase, partial [Candidatus Aminicenantes bacterium]|nr:diguanylate cyclase [Candidatus Aminicenantes bacterium]
MVSDKKYISRLYMLSKGKTFPYHRDIIDIIIRTMGIALDNSMNIKKLESEAHIDPLTSCYNRRALDNYVEHDIANAKRYDGDLSIIMFDIDHFKVINDTYGHGAGDKVLKEISGMIRSTIRGGDYIARYGGEEFVLALPETKLSNAVELAEKLRRKIEN